MDERIIMMINTLTKKKSFCFLENEKVFNPYSTTLWIGITEKIIRKGKEEDILLAQEKGFNSYVKVDDDKCKAAQVWWKEKNEKWMKVRKKWDEVYARNKTLELKKKVENKVLYKHLFSENLTEENKIQDIIEAFVIK